MKKTMTGLALVLALTACEALPALPWTAETAAPAAETVTTPSPAAVAEESARLNAFFETKYQEAIARSPMQQTFLGIKTDYDKWDDASEAAAVLEMEIRRANVAEMRASFDPALLDAQAKLSWRLAEYELEQDERDFAWRGNTYVFSQMRGQHAGIPAFLINQHRITSKADAEAYIARLNGIPVFLGTHRERAEDAAKRGVLPPRFVFDYTIEASENIVTGYPFGGAASGEPSPLIEDFQTKVDTLVADEVITNGEAAELRTAADLALRNAVEPTYRQLIASLEAQRELAGTDDGVWRFDNGGEYYAARLANMTTTDMTAAEIHTLGLAEMDRIHGEMEAIMTVVGFEGSLQDFFEFMRTDPQFYKPETPEGKAEYIAEATALIDDMREQLPLMFNTFPKADMVVKAVEPFRERGAGKAFYQRPAPDGSRPGTYYANLYRMDAMPTYQMAALAYHEGIPGHHMQIAIAQELEGIPSFRKFGGYTPYSEGWGLYTELLPKELGFYEDPYSDFGRLAMELWRAARLVVDTGLHDKRWTREEAIAYLMENTPNPESDCVKAIERYIVMPGQATAYKIGMLKILELRERAKEALGEDFSLADYHDVVLRNGPVPLAILEEQVDAWIAAETEAS